MNLYEISDKLYHIQALLEAWNGEDEEEYKALCDTHEALAATLEDKIDGYVSLIKNLEAENDGFKKEIERMTKLKRANDKKIEWLKNSLHNTLNKLGLKKAKGFKFKVRLQQNAGSLALKVDESELPEQYLKTTVSVDKQGLKNDLKAQGVEENEYCKIVRSESLRVS